MKLDEFGVGKIVKGVNTTKDVGVNQTSIEASKFGSKVDKDGKPPLLHKKAAKNSNPNTLMNLGIGESVELNEVLKRVKGRWALVSKSDPKKVLQYYRGPSDQKPSQEWVNKVERRVHAFDDVNEPVQELRIEKPDPSDTLGIERKFMPQIKTEDYAEFIEFLTKNGAKFRQETIPASDLKAMQSQFSDKGILKQLEKNIAQGPNTKAVIASSDDYILDGHHRWLVAVNTGTDLNVYRVNMPAWKLYDLVNQFQKVYYKDIYDSVEERASIGVPLASGLVVSIFPHRPLKIKPSTPGKLRYDESVTQIDIDELERFADKIFAKVGIDVEFGKHFMDRVNDERNRKPITPAELTRLFKQEFKRWGKPIAQMGPDQEGVMKDLQTDINVPFMLQWDAENKELDLVAKTVMRKKDFKTPDREFPVEGVVDEDNPITSLYNKVVSDFEKRKAAFGGNKQQSPNRYNPATKKQQGILDKAKSWFTDDINEAYMLRLENTDDQLILHVKNTRTGERMEVRGKPNYEIDYDPSDKLHQLLDVIGKASNISELMNGEVVNVNPKHPDGPKSYQTLDAMMTEDLRDWFKEKWVNIGKKDKSGKHPPCGTSGKKSGYAKCVPAAKAAKMSKKEKASATRRKRAAQNKAGRGGTDKPGSGKKPIMVSTKVDEGVNDPHIFKAVFLAGGPGSGKSFVARNILGGTGLRTVNSDDVYEFLMKKQDLALDPDTIASPQGQEIRGKAKSLTDTRMATYLNGKLGLLIDGTGKDVGKYQKQADKLRALGYDLAMIFVNTSEEVAQKRNQQRARKLPRDMVTDMWNTVQENLMKFQQIFGAGRFHIIDNSGGLEDLDRQKNFDKVYNEIQRFLNTPPSKRAALAWIQQQQKAQNDGTQRSEREQNTKSDGGTTSSN